VLGIEVIGQRKALEDFSKRRVIPRGSWWQWDSLEFEITSTERSNRCNSTIGLGTDLGTGYGTGLQVDWNPDGKLVWGIASRISRIGRWDSR